MFVGALVLVIGGSYLYASVRTLGDQWTLQAFLTWPMQYGGGKLGIWGVIDASRIKPLAQSVVSSFIPIWEGLGLRALMQGQIELDKIIRLFSLPALALVLALPLLITLRHLVRRQRLLIGILLAAYVSYLVFVFWWDPFEPKWLVVPNIAAWAVLAILWDKAAQSRWLPVLPAALLLIAVANFQGTIWSRHVAAQAMATADCLAEYVGPEDLLVTQGFEYGEFAYLRDGDIFSLTTASSVQPDHAAVIDELKAKITATQQAGGDVYAWDIAQVPQAQWDWLANATGLTPDELGFLRGQPVFSCDDWAFAVLPR